MGTIDDYRDRLRPDHKHATIGEAGQCPPCRDRNITSVRETYGGTDLFSHYWLSFVDRTRADGEAVYPVTHDSVALHLGCAIVPGPDLSTAIDNAWACGCNPGGEVAGHELPHDLVEHAGVRTCVLLHDQEIDDARHALTAARDELHGHD